MRPRLRQPLDQLLRQRLAAVEKGRVRLIESQQPLVRVGDVQQRLTRRSRRRPVPGHGRPGRHSGAESRGEGDDVREALCRLLGHGPPQDVVQPARQIRPPLVE